MSDKLSFKQSMERIDKILELLEKNEIDLEEAIDLFEEGLKLVHDCDQQLAGFKDKMNELIQNYEGEDHA
ncbi:exodeoxyribonuclease VII small subunit [Traorella massiliensis]|uniref:exodeoxyribonuclease VII small subunit n=1 Tax=Traorella massiliensis TaxID=1903263 RepID=UPI002352641D|nr:exodeoxyribonuclease VII small subunit [Traorella massiliensis]